MKRIIEGQTYNTETSTEIVSGENFHSSAWWALYQTRAGAFFKVVINHDGEEVLFFDRVSDEEAAQIVAERAPNLLEKYFDGMFPEGGSAEKRLTVRLPINLAKRIEAAAELKGASVNAYVMRALEKVVAEDGQRPAMG
jgi:HicB-like protein involved in pilus formation